jgi:hypothetical protein
VDGSITQEGIDWFMRMREGWAGQRVWKRMASLPLSTCVEIYEWVIYGMICCLLVRP